MTVVIGFGGMQCCRGAQMRASAELARPSILTRWAFAGLVVAIGTLLVFASASSVFAATLVDAGFESGTDGAALASPPGRSRASPSAPSTTPPAPRTARCRAGSRARPRPPTRRLGAGGHDLQRRRVPLLDLRRHRQREPLRLRHRLGLRAAHRHHRQGRSSTPSAPPPATPPTPTPRWAPTPPAGPSTASCSTSRSTPTRSPGAPAQAMPGRS